LFAADVDDHSGGVHDDASDVAECCRDEHVVGVDDDTISSFATVRRVGGIEWFGLLAECTAQVVFEQFLADDEVDDWFTGW